MRMNAADARKYPRFARYVRNSMPTVAKVGIIARNMKKFGSLDNANLEAALKWGSDPLVVIKPLPANACGVGGASNGCFRSANPKQIEIDKSRVEEFENRLAASKDKNSSGRSVYIVGTTLLHEMCHWGNQKAGTAEPKDLGTQFEIKTYGRNTG